MGHRRRWTRVSEREGSQRERGATRAEPAEERRRVRSRSGDELADRGAAPDRLPVRVAGAASYNEVRMTPATTADQHLLTSRLEIRAGRPPAAVRGLLGHPGPRVRRARATHRAGGDRDLGGGDGRRRSPRPTSAGTRWPRPASGTGSPSCWPRPGTCGGRGRDRRGRPARCGPPARRRRPAGPRSHWVHETLDYVRGRDLGRHHLGRGPRPSARASARTSRTWRWPCCARPGCPPGTSRATSPGQDAPLDKPVSAESHAWVEFWAGEWLPLDPSNLSEVAERHVLVARGRDYADVRPLAGVYSGPAAESLGVNVQLTRLR